MAKDVGSSFEPFVTAGPCHVGGEEPVGLEVSSKGLVRPDGGSVACGGEPGKRHHFLLN